MQLKCRKCGSDKIVKNGKVFGWQRHKCKDCGYQFTKTSPAGKPLQIKLIAHELYVAGLSMREISSIVGVTPQSVSRWIRKWHLHDIGDKENISVIKGRNLTDALGINGHDKLLTSTINMPSGAKFNIVIKLPQRQ